MAVSSCPQCARQITLPEGASTSARVRCPLCRSEYQLSDALNHVPPVLELIEEAIEREESFELADDPEMATPLGLATTADGVAASGLDEQHGFLPVEESLAPPADPIEVASFEDEIAAETAVPAAPIAERAESEADELDFDDEELEHDDFAMQEKDTEVEEFAAMEPLEDELPTEAAKLIDAGHDDESVFELDSKPLAGEAEEDDEVKVVADDDEMTLDFDDEPIAEALGEPLAEPAAKRAVEPAGELDDLGIDFDQRTPVAAESKADEGELSFDDFSVEQSVEAESNAEEPELSFDDFSSPQPAAAESGAGEPELSFDLEEAAAAENGAETGEPAFDFSAPPAGEHAESEEIEFNFDEQPSMNMAANGEDMALDFGEPQAGAVEPVMAAEVAQSGEAAADAEEADSKKKKKKAKKEKKPRAAKPAGAAGRRSSIGTLVGALLGAVIAIPLALIGMLWLGPAFDILGVGPSLPGWMVPASVSKGARGRIVASVPPIQNTMPGQPAPVAPEQPTAQPPADPNVAATAPPAAAPESPVAQPRETNQSAPPAAEPAASSPAASQPSADVAAPPAAEAPKNEAAVETAPAVADTSATAPPVESVAKDDATQPPHLEPAPGKTATSVNKPVAESAAPLAPIAEATLPEPQLPEVAPEPKLPEPAEAPPKEAADTGSPFEDKEPAAAEAPAEAAPAQGAPFGLRNAPHYTLPEVAVAMQAAQAAGQKLLMVQGSQDEAALKKPRSQFYLSLFRMAEVFTFTQDSAASRRNARQLIQPMLVQFMRDPKRLDAIKFNAARWLAFPKRTTSGVMLAGGVQEVNRAGNLYKIKIGIGLEGPAPIVTVLQSEDPHVSAGDQAIVLGSILDRPAEQLEGYSGNEDTVVLSGLTVKGGDKL